MKKLKRIIESIKEEIKFFIVTDYRYENFSLLLRSLASNKEVYYIDGHKFEVMLEYDHNKLLRPARAESILYSGKRLDNCLARVKYFNYYDNYNLYFLVNSHGDFTVCIYLNHAEITGHVYNEKKALTQIKGYANSVVAPEYNKMLKIFFFVYWGYKYDDLIEMSDNNYPEFTGCEF